MHSRTKSTDATILVLLVAMTYTQGVEPKKNDRTQGVDVWVGLVHAPENFRFDENQA